VAFLAGLGVGVLGCRLAMGRSRMTEALPPPALTAPEPTAASAPQEPAPEAVAEAATEAPAAEALAEDPASAVDDVVAELERRVKGRRTDGEADRPTGGRRGRDE
jgi:outer membrane receptor protein involved in Fe transport